MMLPNTIMDPLVARRKESSTLKSKDKISNGVDKGGQGECEFRNYQKIGLKVVN